MAEKKKPMSVCEMLAEALKIPVKNPKLSLSVVLLYLLPLSLLFLPVHALVNQLLDDMVAKLMVLATMGDPHSPLAKPILDSMVVDVMKLSKVFIVLGLIFYVLYLFVWIVTVHTAEAIHLGRQVTPRDMLFKIRTSWKGTLITFLMTTVVVEGSLVVFFVLLAFIVFVTFDSPGLLMGLAVLVLFILAFFSFLYLGFFCALARVVSVVEEGCHGVAAFEKASEVLRLKRRRLQGLRLALVLWFVASVVTLIVKLPYSAIKAGAASRLLLGLLLVNLTGLLNLFAMAVYTLFYHDCKQSDVFAMDGVELMYEKLPPSLPESGLP